MCAAFLFSDGKTLCAFILNDIAAHCLIKYEIGLAGAANLSQSSINADSGM